MSHPHPSFRSFSPAPEDPGAPSFALSDGGDEYSVIDALEEEEEGFPAFQRLGCPATGQPCCVAPLPDGWTTEVVVTPSPARWVRVPLAHVPAVRCADCGAISFDLATLTAVDMALVPLLRAASVTPEAGVERAKRLQRSTTANAPRRLERFPSVIEYGALLASAAPDAAQ